MKTALLYAFGASVLLLPVLAGCSQEAPANPSPPAAQATNSAMLVADSTPAPAAQTETPSAVSDPPPPPQPDSPPASAAPDNATVSTALPPNIYPTSPLAQVVRLSQAGVDSGIVLTFVTNSSGTFNLDSDKIIYLRDIGVPNEIITAMMQRDQQLQQQTASANPPSEPPQPPPPTTDTTPEVPPVEESTPPPVTVTYFYDTLAPYGAWIDVNGYGRCWRPSVCVSHPGWRPYCDAGHWVYTDCGWYWYSDYSWGWAPFHYGRWFLDSHWGWCWAPDSVWAPSWVTWRYSSGYCGWAPLPPFATYQAGIGFIYRGAAVSLAFNWGLSENCFTFVPTQFFCDPHPRRHCVDSAQAGRIYRATTVINNFNVHDRAFVNRGIDPERITAVTRTPIHPVALRSARPAEPGPQHDRFSGDGRTLIVNRPAPDRMSRPAGAPAQHYAQPVMPAQPRPNEFPGATARDSQGGHSVRIQPQPNWPSAGNNPEPVPAPSQPNRDYHTYSPRTGQQVHSQPARVEPTDPWRTAGPDPGQRIPAESPPPAHSQPSQPAPSPAPRSSGQGAQGGNNYQGNGPGPAAGPRH